MKKTITLSAAVIAGVLSACNSSTAKKETTTPVDSVTQTFKLDTTKLKSAETFYQCEMDADVLSDKPGKCPKCGMDLEKMTKK